MRITNCRKNAGSIIKFLFKNKIHYQLKDGDKYIEIIKGLIKQTTLE